LAKRIGEIWREMASPQEATQHPLDLLQIVSKCRWILAWSIGLTAFAVSGFGFRVSGFGFSAGTRNADLGTWNVERGIIVQGRDNLYALTLGERQRPFPRDGLGVQDHRIRPHLLPHLSQSLINGRRTKSLKMHR
jgi:hypothetical protein